MCSEMCVQVAEFLADPLCRGVFAGDSSILSMRSCFPIFYSLEQDFSSIVIGSLLRKRGWSKCVHVIYMYESVSQSVISNKMP